MDVVCRLDGHVQLKEGRLQGAPRVDVLGEEGHLPEGGRLLARVFAEHARVDVVHLFVQHREAGVGHSGADVGHHRIAVQIARDEDMPHGKTLVESELAGLSGGQQLLRPQRARNVAENAAAVALPVDEAGAVLHFDEGVQNAQDVFVRGPSVFLDHADDATGIVLGEVMVPKAGDLAENNALVVHHPPVRSS